MVEVLVELKPLTFSLTERKERTPSYMTRSNLAIFQGSYSLQHL